jgi:C4-dicarboxylate transporter DctM subunit
MLPQGCQIRNSPELTIAVWPWLVTMLLPGVVTYVPQISLWLPRLLGMM